MKIFQTQPFWYTELQFGAIFAGFALSLLSIVLMSVALTLGVFVLNPELMELSEKAVLDYFNSSTLQLAFLSLVAVCVLFGGVLTAWLAEGCERLNVRALMALWTYINALILPFWWNTTWWEMLAGLLGPAAFVWLGAVPVELFRGKSIKP